MATHDDLPRLALRTAPVPGSPAGAWWPQSRSLGTELTELFALWPDEAGRIVRLLYSPPDWEDRPRSVAVGAGRRIKTGCFPDDDTHNVTLSMMDGSRRVITVIPPDSSPDAAAAVLATFPASTSGRSAT